MQNSAKKTEKDDLDDDSQTSEASKQDHNKESEDINTDRKEITDADVFEGIGIPHTGRGGRWFGRGCRVRGIFR